VCASVSIVPVWGVWGWGLRCLCSSCIVLDTSNTNRKGHTMSIYLEDLAQDELETIAEAYDLDITWGQDFAILNH